MCVCGGGGMCVEETGVGEKGRESESETEITFYVFILSVLF